MTVLPPETLEGWYALHQLYAVDHAARAALAPARCAEIADCSAGALGELLAPAEGGWSRVVPLAGSPRADVLLVHLRPTLDDLLAVERRVAALPAAPLLRRVDAFLSVTEAGLYHLTAQLQREAEARGGRAGDDEWRSALEQRVAAERESAHVRRRLYPEPPAEMPYVCFYPMSKRREAGQNWYALPLEERSRLMYAHGTTGRRYAGRVLQIITGSIGLAAWEWGVTLFASDPLAFKKLVTEMRFDEVSARYAEFGEFHVGKVAGPREWLEAVIGA